MQRAVLRLEGIPIIVIVFQRAFEMLKLSGTIGSNTVHEWASQYRSYNENFATEGMPN